MMDHPALELPPLLGEEMVPIADDVQTAINDMLLGPGGSRRAEFRQLADRTYDTVHHDPVEPIEPEPQLLCRLDKDEVVEFIDIVFIQERVVDRSSVGRPAIRGRRIHTVEVMSQSPPEQRDAGGDHHESHDEPGAYLVFPACTGDRREELMEQAMLGGKSDKPPR